MANLMHAARLYRTTAITRGVRAQEADVFRRATGALRAARDAAPVDRVRAVADNRLLWITVRGLLRDPDNRLEASLRASLISVALAVLREMDDPATDLDFLIAVNENITAGLAIEGG